MSKVLLNQQPGAGKYYTYICCQKIRTRYKKMLVHIWDGKLNKKIDVGSDYGSL
jgi:hypothetical protein